MVVHLVTAGETSWAGFGCGVFSAQSAAKSDEPLYLVMNCGPRDPGANLHPM